MTSPRAAALATAPRRVALLTLLATIAEVVHLAL